MAAHPESSLPNQMQSWAALIGAYRLLNHPKVTMSDLLKPHCIRTLTQAERHSVVLWVEDTSELSFTHHPATSGLGPTGDGKGRGLLLHSTLGVLPGQRRVLGLGHVQVVLRQPKAKKRLHWSRSPESQLWERSAQAIGRPSENVLWVHVSDSGSDNFAYLATCRQHDKHFLVRLFQNRVLSWEAGTQQAQQEESHKMLDYARSLAPHPRSEYSLFVAATKQQPAREARIVVTWAAVTLATPVQAPPEVKSHPPFSAWVIRAWEPAPPEDAEGVEWILLTSLPVKSLEDAREKVDWYTHRWLCEDFHQCLKTGCKIEDTQLDEGDDIQRLLGFLAPIAVRLLQLRQDVRWLPETPADQTIDPMMITILVRLLKIQDTPLSIEHFWRGVAKLGGHLGRKRDGPPGWRTLWRGWRYLADLTYGAHLFHDTS